MKIKDINDKIPNSTNYALSAVEKKIPDVNPWQTWEISDMKKNIFYFFWL